MQRTKASLVLDDGTTYPGYLIGAHAGVDRVSGAVAVTTDMFGYQRQMTDPARDGQVLVFTTPQVGNVGWNVEDSANDEGRITPAAVVVRDLPRTTSNFRAARSLEEELKAQGVVGICGVDTRSLSRHIRSTNATSATLIIKEDN